MMPVVRTLCPADTGQIAQIAGELDNFTVPPAYVIWMLCETQGSLCLVAEDSAGKVVAYMLALMTASPSTVFIWQLGVLPNSELDVTSAKGLYLICERALAIWRSHSVHHIWFTSSSDRAIALISRLAEDLAGAIPVPQTPTWPAPCGNERLYLLTI